MPMRYQTSLASDTPANANPRDTLRFELGRWCRRNTSANWRPRAHACARRHRHQRRAPPPGQRRARQRQPAACRWTPGRAAPPGRRQRRGQGSRRGRRLPADADRDWRADAGHLGAPVQPRGDRRRRRRKAAGAPTSRPSSSAVCRIPAGRAGAATGRAHLRAAGAPVAAQERRGAGREPSTSSSLQPLAGHRHRRLRAARQEARPRRGRCGQPGHGRGPRGGARVAPQPPRAGDARGAAGRQRPVGRGRRHLHGAPGAASGHGTAPLRARLQARRG